MPEGFDWSTPPFAKKVYDWPFGKTFLILAAICLPAAVAVTIYTHGPNPALWHAQDWIYMLVVGFGVSGLSALVLCWVGRVDLTPDAIGTVNDYGVRQTIRLVDIQKAFMPWYGLNVFIVVRGKNPYARLWIPTFLKDMGDFKASLARVAPPENPLRAFLERGSGGSR